MIRVVTNGRAPMGVLSAMVTCLLSVTPVAGQEQDPYDAVITANEAFAAGRYEEALGKYEAAVKTLGDSPELDYNRAAAHYKLEQYEPAANLLAKAALSPDLDLGRRARFNWGNCDYASALAELSPVLPSAPPGGSSGAPGPGPSLPGAGVAAPPAAAQPDSQKAMDKLQSAIRHYRGALDTGGDTASEHPTDRAARENIERAQRLIDLLEEMKQQQEQQQQQQDQQQNQDQQSPDDQQQQEEQDQQQEQQQDKDQQQPEQQDQQPPDQSQDNQDQQPRPEEQQDQEMTPQEAEAVLQAVRDNEKQRREEKARRIRRQRVPVIEDW